MGLAKRIMPVILHKNGQLVKGQKFINDRIIGHALQAARIHAMRGVDELMILDVTASQEGREPNYGLIEALSENCFSPVTVGGGIKTAEHVKQLLRSGADKVCIGSTHIVNKTVDVSDLSGRFGRSTIVVSLDTRSDDGWNTARLNFLAKIAKGFETKGAGEILLQSICRDGTLGGYDLDLIKEVSSHVNIPLIASGGCSGYEDMYQAIQCGASAVAAGALFAFTDSTPKGAAKYLASKGIEVRQ